MSQASSHQQISTNAGQTTGNRFNGASGLVLSPDKQFQTDNAELIKQGKNQESTNQSASNESGKETGTSGINEEGKTPNEAQGNNVVYEHHRNTITVQSTKVIGEFNYSFVSVSPTKKSLVDTPLLKKIKAIQANELRNWKGLPVEYVSRPGLTLNVQATRKETKTLEYLKMEDERCKILLEGLIRYREWEEERMNTVYQFQQEQSQKQKEITLRGPEYLTFKNLKDPLILIKDGPLPIPAFQKNAMLNANVAGAVGGVAFLDQTHHDLLFKLIKTDGKLIRAVLENNGFLQTESNHDWNILWTCQSLKINQYEGLSDTQKINHFPQSFELTRKDRLCYNVVQMQEKFGKEEFNIIPDTYILPDEFADFYSHFHKLKAKEVQSNLWIIKPQNSSQGKGIYIIDDISEVPIDESCIVSRYITNPLLINGLKFDLRVYVLITSFDPWRIYVYDEGLARFASEPYNAPSSDTSSSINGQGSNKGNKFAHLTNYSINKKNEKYVQNANAEQDDTGHKWSLAAFSKHLEQVLGVDQNLMWSKIYDVIIKSLLSVDSIVYQNLKKLSNKNNCFELLGYDILVDNDLKPWLMEVNLSPSLATDSPLDVKIKSNLIVDTFNLVGIKKFDRRRDNLTKMKNRVKNIMRAKSYQSRQVNPSQQAPNGGVPAQSKNVAPQKGQPGPQGQIPDEKVKKNAIPGGVPGGQEFGSESEFFNKNKQLFERISQTNGRHRDILRETLQEQVRKNNFVRIYPAKGCEIYDQYFYTPRPSNRFIQRYLFYDDVIPYPPGYTFGTTSQGHNAQQASSSNTTRQARGLIGDIDPNQLLVGQMLANGGIVVSATSHQMLKEQEQQIKSQVTSNNNRTSSAFMKTHKPQQQEGTSVTGGSSPSKKNQLQLGNQVQAPSSTSVSEGLLPQTASPIIQPFSVQNSPPPQKEKLLITGDDVLIEYVGRLMIAVKSIKEHMLRPIWKHQIEKFIKHYVWHSSDMRRAENNKLWQRLESRLIEMKERRKRLLKSLYKKENPQHVTMTANPAANVTSGPSSQGQTLNPNSSSSANNKQGLHPTLTQAGQLDFEKEYELKEEQKNVIIQGFSAAQLEEMLRTSTKNVAYEVISCLIESNGRGVLTEIIKWLTTCNQNLLNDNESILNQLSRKKDIYDSDEEPESFAPQEGGSSPIKVGHAGVSGNQEIRIKIRKNSVDPHSNKVKSSHNYHRLRQQQKAQQQQQQNAQSPERQTPSALRDNNQPGATVSNFNVEESPVSVGHKNESPRQTIYQQNNKESSTQLLNHDIFHSFGGATMSNLARDAMESSSISDQITPIQRNGTAENSSTFNQSENKTNRSFFYGMTNTSGGPTSLMNNEMKGADDVQLRSRFVNAQVGNSENPGGGGSTTYQISSYSDISGKKSSHSIMTGFVISDTKIKPTLEKQNHNGQVSSAVTGKNHQFQQQSSNLSGAPSEANSSPVEGVVLGSSQAKNTSSQNANSTYFKTYSQKNSLNDTTQSQQNNLISSQHQSSSTALDQISITQAADSSASSAKLNQVLINAIGKKQQKASQPGQQTQASVTTISSSQQSSAGQSAPNTGVRKTYSSVKKEQITLANPGQFSLNQGTPGTVAVSEIIQMTQKKQMSTSKANKIIKSQISGLSQGSGGGSGN